MESEPTPVACPWKKHRWKHLRQAPSDRSIAAFDVFRLFEASLDAGEVVLVASLVESQRAQRPMTRGSAVERRSISLERRSVQVVRRVWVKKERPFIPMLLVNAHPTLTLLLVWLKPKRANGLTNSGRKAIPI